jgi:hypothetical protein
MKRSHTYLTSILLAAACVCAAPAHASLISNGITYTLTETDTGNPLVDQFTLSIFGINGASDTEGGRYGVESFALNRPSGFISAGAPAGFTYEAGGLNANGCNGSGNFFCFTSNADPTGPALAANSSLSFVFTLTASSFDGYVPDFKINWVGTKRNYNLVSLPLAPQGPPPSTEVPEPATLSLLGIGAALAAIGLITRRRKPFI